ncbi:SDR family oxidoreductase [Mucilaginibacter celer]|uniref:SDR family oxidoreductase n=1 Tax=Mucilaginibacter celer TaxID=2305508 RepID=A0A494VM18_9SPHI|nr:SDR family oxidoreductase [Mucilaginibacter celer]AYL95644.1 SDR family oxidoreductase [Mucilaginibacter celer]
MDNFLLSNKVIIITGGTGILGQAFINGIVRAGGTVAILGRNKEIAEQRAAQLQKNGAKALALIADVTSEHELKAARHLVLDTFGKIDGLVNAAGGNMPGGIIQPHDSLFSFDIEALRQVIDLNLYGTILPTRVFGEAIAENGSGSIVNISSMASQQAITKVLGYSLAKGAVDTFTKWFAVELANRYGDRIRSNAIAPGFFLTEQNKNLLTTPTGSYTERGNLVIDKTPFKRFGSPDELVGALVWLLSDASRFVTGTVITVDGGFSVFSGV